MSVHDDRGYQTCPFHSGWAVNASAAGFTGRSRPLDDPPLKKVSSKES